MNWYHAWLATFLVVLGVLIFYAGFRIGEQAARGGPNAAYASARQLRDNRPGNTSTGGFGSVASENRADDGLSTTAADRAVFINERGVTTGAPVLESVFNVERDTRRFVKKAKPAHILNAVFAPRQYADRQWRIAAAATTENSVDRRVNVLWRRYRKNSGAYYWQPTIISEAESNSWILRLVDVRSGGRTSSRDPRVNNSNINDGSVIVRDEDIAASRNGAADPPGPARAAPTRRRRVVATEDRGEYVEYDAYGERIVRRRNGAADSRSEPLSSGSYVR